MKTYIYLFIIALVAITTSATKPVHDASTKLLVYYFHLESRCKTCASIEETVTQILNDDYKNELDKKIIFFKSFNADDKANEAICRKYGAYGSTLALTKVKAGKEGAIEDLTNLAFSKIGNKELFKTELKAKINASLK